MKTLLTAGLLFAAATLSFSQLNMTLLDQLPYEQELSDIWGYADPATGIEYALVGVHNGVSIVSLEDPMNIEEVAFIPGENSIWRDIKTWGPWAYVVTDQSGTTEGLTVIDLRDLPNSAPFFHWTPNLPELGQLRKCHNLYIDENGYAYLAGCNINSGGMLYVDVFTEPGNPIFVAPGPSVYSHDVYVRGDTMYSAEINAGRLGIYEISDKQNSIFLASQNTPFAKAHNVWLSDDSQIAFTTDEVANAPVTAYDISNLPEIEELDQYRPIETLQDGVVPHNVHVWNDWLIISYYTDGGRVVDASRPHNLIEVGNFDTFFGGGAGFNGVWGAYPFLPSGKVLLTDIGNGLYLLDANYVRACWLEGLVTDAGNNAPLNNVTVEIDADQPNLANTFLDGTYASGLATAGTYDVTFFKEGYLPLTVSVDLDNGMVTELNVQLQQAQSFTLLGATVEDGSGVPVPNAEVWLENQTGAISLTSDGNGLISLADFTEGVYDVYVGAWGYQTLYLEDYTLLAGQEAYFTLEPGYEDDFVLDLGWSTFGVMQEGSDELTGYWERGEPYGTYFGSGAGSNPENDLPDDLGDACYVTGNNADSNIGGDDVDDGTVYLVSPAMDLSTYAEPVLSYTLWFRNGGGSSDPDDNMKVSISNGIDTVELEYLTDGSIEGWREQSVFNLNEVIALTNEMRVHFETSDFDPTGHIVEAAVDGFSVVDAAVVTVVDPFLELDWEVAPNPFGEQSVVRYDLPTGLDRVQLELYDLWGRQLASYQLSGEQGRQVIGRDVPAGLYILQLRSEDRVLDTVKIVKQ